MRPIINSNKHYVQTTLSTLTPATGVANIILAQALDVPVAGNATHVRTGSIIKAVFVEHWIRTGDTAPGAVQATLLKIPGAGVVPIVADMAALHAYNNKKNVFYVTQGLTNDQDADATPFIRQWYKIPKSKQRFGLDDLLVLNLRTIVLDQIHCGVAVYKEYN